MNTIILNGSPRGKNGNTEIFTRQFIKEMKAPCEIKYIVNEDAGALARYIKNFDSVIIILPLYIHAMPGIVMKFFEQMEPALTPGKSIGFILQAGFPEAAQQKYVERYFASLAEQLNYTYLGTVSKGEAAAVYMMPKFMTRKLFKMYNKLGKIYEETDAFDKDITDKLGQPYLLKKSSAALYEFANKTGLNNIGWHSFLKKNHAFEKRLDRPFLIQEK